LIARILGIRSKAFEKADLQLRTEVTQFSGYENEFQKNKLTLQTEEPVSKVPSALLASLVYNTVYEGKLYRDWVKGIKEGDAARIDQVVKGGINQNLSSGDIVAGVIGTKANKFKDGALHSTRLNSQAVIRQTNTHVQSMVKGGIGDTNEQFNRYIWNSVLDTRTTPICRELSEKVFVFGEGPLPPVHIGCRSTITILLKGEPVPDNMSYNDWLKKQPAAMQDDVLGKTNGKAYRKGGLSVGDFQDRRGQSYTIEEMESRHPSAYE
jgi:hypothetical protein